ncbi:restriction endonuclease subunit S [Candidatus Synechococcus calcipolaris G9]|uniref:Restriction endonuclease subunit S n=1 Tax=Candidatus Synechococcus calcipolaris G9 TaxID=1497997 RepID=A0ABT6EZT5_9SYNE|nr:restriction endonuclease subunit S [Candidatus Synechococcus calcipolaris]MDG2991087.1 restriction endonuclease subunit S [Candidatus Synechococcus calcipolaris G9]
MKLRISRYEQYKESEIDGLVKIPCHWRLERLKFIAEVRSGVAKGRNLSGKKTIELPYLRVANVQENRLELDNISRIEIQLSEEARYSLKPGDVLMTEGGDNDKLGRGAVWKGQIPRCLHQNHVFAVRPFDSENSYWINWMTQTEFLKYFFLSRSKQTTNLASISSTNLKITPIIFPPLHERLAITRYLDTRTAQIDRKIDLLTQKAQRYEELKRAIINETVTRGLDKSVPMKNSGIEWIGKIPEHWEIKRIKDITESDVSVKTPSQLKETDLIEFVPMSNIDENIGRIKEFSFVTLDTVSSGYTKFKNEDVIFAKITPCMENGNVALVKNLRHGIGFGSTEFMVFRSQKELLPKYLHYFFHNILFRKNAEPFMKGTAGQKRITSLYMSTHGFGLPPLDEQKAIAHYLDTKTDQIDQIIQTINTQIEKLKELRKTLINDVVTGKIKVIDN